MANCIQLCRSSAVEDIKVEQALASEESDRRMILNSIAGVKDLASVPSSSHPGRQKKTTIADDPWKQQTLVMMMMMMMMMMVVVAMMMVMRRRRRNRRTIDD